MQWVPALKLLVAGDDRVGLVDWASGDASARELPAVYRFDGAAALGSQQPIRAFGLSWHAALGVLVSCHERVGVLGPDLTHERFLDISPLWFMTHAIAVRDDVLYTCNARIDVIGEHDLASGAERFLHVGKRRTIPNPQHVKPLRDGYEHDRHHPNAIVALEDEVFVLTHPVRDDGVGTEVLVLDRSTLQPVDTVPLDERPFGAPYAHDLAVIDGPARHVLWCDTYRCSVRSSDGRSSGRLANETTFLRGLAADSEDVYVGVATARTSTGTAERDSWVVRLDASSLGEIERVRVPFPIEICTVRIADGADFGHPGAGPAPIAGASVA